MFTERKARLALAALAVRQRRLARGEHLYHAAERSRAMYVVASGSFKSRMSLQDGRDQVIGFYLEGEVLGLDAIGSGHHRVDVEALQDSEVAVVPLERIRDLAVQRELYGLLAEELARGHTLMAMLGALSAGERLAAFLLDLSRRRGERGAEDGIFILPMGRHEIGNHLGLTLETVSRMFSRFQEAGLIDVRHKYVRIIDPAGLEAATLRGGD